MRNNGLQPKVCFIIIINCLLFESSFLFPFPDFHEENWKRVFRQKQSITHEGRSPVTISDGLEALYINLKLRDCL